MDNETLINKLALWRERQKEADRLADEIRAEVLARGEPFLTEVASAQWFAGRTTYDWEVAVFEHPQALVDLTCNYLKPENLAERFFTEIGKKWKLTPPVKIEPKPSVKLIYA